MTAVEALWRAKGAQSAFCSWSPWTHDQINGPGRRPATVNNA